MICLFRAGLVLLLCGVALAQPPRPPYSPEQLSLLRETSAARLSPDGRTVAFVTDITGEPELWSIPASGGWPRQITSLHEQILDFRWSPDGSSLIFSADTGGDERPDLYRIAAHGGMVEKLTTTPMAENEPRFSPDGKQVAFLADPERAFVFQLHVLDLGTRQIRQLTREAVKVGNPCWSPDGSTVALTRSGDDQKGELLLVEVRSGKARVVEPPVAQGILIPVDFAPDGSALLLLSRNAAGFLQLGLLDLEPGAVPESGRVPRGSVRLIGPGDWDVTEARWTEQGIAFLRNEGGAISLNQLRAPADKPRVLLPATGVLNSLSFDSSGKKLCLLREDSRHPADVWVGSCSLTSVPELKQITYSLLGGVEPERLAEATIVKYRSFDSLPIHTVLLKPPVCRLGTPPPAIVVVHGGPNGQVLLDFNSTLQLFAEAGFAVIAPNYRGSTGYGKAFEDANNKDWGGGDLKDLVAGVKHFAAQGLIDPKRVGITGGSYGGYLTLMALCKTPDVWAAGVERYGMPDLLMDYLLTKSRFGDWYETEMGNPRTHAALFRERSPLPYLEDLKAPLLIFQGARDSNVPKSESDLLVAVLGELRKQHEYVVYPDEGHGFTRRKNILDHYQRTLAFFVKHLGQHATPK